MKRRYAGSQVCASQTKIGGNETAGRACFRGLLRGFVAQIEYSHPRKVPRKRDARLAVSFSKSLGEIVFSRWSNVSMHHAFEGSDLPHRRRGSVRLRRIYVSSHRSSLPRDRAMMYQAVLQGGCAANGWSMADICLVPQK